MFWITLLTWGFVAEVVLFYSVYNVAQCLSLTICSAKQSISSVNHIVWKESLSTPSLLWNQNSVWRKLCLADAAPLSRMMIALLVTATVTDPSKPASAPPAPRTHLPHVSLLISLEHEYHPQLRQISTTLSKTMSSCPSPCPDQALFVLARGRSRVDAGTTS